MTKQELKKLFADNLKKVSGMGVQTYTLYRKWQELNELKLTSADKQKIWEIKQSVWIPKKPDDYLQLEPEVIVADGKENAYIWTMLRRLTTNGVWSQSPGRFGKFLVRDKKTMTYMGVISIGSDFISIGGRDSYIGWTMKDKMEMHRLNNLAMGSSIVPCQPLGYNFVGGKLLALLTVSEVIEDFWNTRYAEKLVGVTTTSFFGSVKSSSQYTGLSYWKSCKFSEGSIPIEPEESVYKEIKEWVKENFPVKFAELMAPRKGGPASHVRPRLLAIAHKELGVKATTNNFSRGVYFCELYNNTNAFLCNKEELGEKRFDNSVKALSEVWRQKYARKRVEKLVREDKYNTDTLFYDSMIGMSWEDTKTKYLNDVGR